MVCQKKKVFYSVRVYDGETKAVIWVATVTLQDTINRSKLVASHNLMI